MKRPIQPKTTRPAHVVSTEQLAAVTGGALMQIQAAPTAPMPEINRNLK
jgi:hypothetical protein